ncbi:MAG: carbamoyl-phosphate synthase large subunit [Candidatus Micrarchaeota archaeon]|nr:carbamoyl-phosphate synthase large subunit [Candidatus Micrarchaeota archaeon]
MSVRKNNIKKVLVIGSGPIVIGQAAEFDYSGSQACASLRAEGVEVVVVNSNPATIQTDNDVADIVYIEPLRWDVIEKIIEKERPDGLIATMGGQTALNLAVELHEKGVLEKYGVEILGTGIESIRLAEDRGKFKELMQKIGEPVPESIAANSMDEAFEFAREHAFPLILRPAYTLGGTGGGIARNIEEFERLLELGFNLSPAHQVLVEESVLGLGEFEYEMIRDSYDNCITICNMENIDPMGIHTGESIVVAPSQTLTDDEHQMLRSAAIKIIRALKIEGGCNIQFALDQKTGKYYVIEVNPRLSRSSALASKATGYPIARVAAKIALGLGLHEIRNAVTKTTPAAFEPALDYCVIKIPRWPFDKIPEGDRTIGTQMKSTGETMAIGRTFEEAFGKALRSIEVKKPKIRPEDIEYHLTAPTDLRIFAIMEALKKGWSKERICHLTNIHPWFIDRIENYVMVELRLKREPFGRKLLHEAKKHGYSDEQIASIIGHEAEMVRQMRKKAGILPAYKMVDTCAAEFAATTPYYYSTYEEENESIPSCKRKMIIIGSGPIRIGQGIEFDYCCCHAAFALREMGIEAIMINNNPETVSTDFDTSDKLYFEPLTYEDVMNIIEHEKPEGVIVQFGGQTAINLAQKLEMSGVKIVGTPAEGIDIAEDREKFKQLLHKLEIRQPENATATTEEEAVAAAAKIGYPIIVRPSYVIAGRGMQIVYDEESLRNYIKEAVEVSERRPVLIDKYIEKAIECEIDGVADGERLFVGGIMEHIERAGVHSGDALNVVPCVRLKKAVQEKIIEYSEKIALALGTIGAINIQYVVQNDVIYVLEANPRASRTMPFLSKAIGIPLIKLATKVIVGKKLSELGMREMPKLKHYAVKGVVFPFLKLPGTDTVTGPEMRSTGESMGIDDTYPAALWKALLGAGLKIPESGGVAISLKDGDKERAAPLAEELEKLGFVIYATPTTARFLPPNTNLLKKIADGEPNIISEIKKGKIHLVFNTPKRGRIANTDGFKIRRTCLERNIPCITSFEACEALVEAMKEAREKKISVERANEYGKDKKRQS